MALTTYAQLVSAIGDWLGGRSDLAVADFITLAEARFNRTIRVEANHATASLTIDAATEAVPAGLKQVDYIQIAGQKAPLGYLSPQAFEFARQSYDYAGTPVVYTRVGPNFHFLPVPGSSVTATIAYWTAISPLSSGVNWLLEGHPDIYLCGALVESAPYLDDDSRLPMWQARLDSALDELRLESARSATGPSVVPRARRAFGG